MKSSRIICIAAVCALLFHTGCANSVFANVGRYESTHQIQQAAKGQDSHYKKFGKLKVSEKELLRTAYRYIGVPYRWGGTTPRGFDCSGFVAYCLTGQYQRLGNTYTFLGWPQVSDPQPGDVCVNAGHCGIYIGDGMMIHAADYGIGVIKGPVQSGMIYVRY